MRPRLVEQIAQPKEPPETVGSFHRLLPGRVYRGVRTVREQERGAQARSPSAPFVAAKSLTSTFTREYGKSDDAVMTHGYTL